MKTRHKTPQSIGLTVLDASQTEVLTQPAERAILEEMAECRQKLTKALEDLGESAAQAAGDDPIAYARNYALQAPEHARLGIVYRRYVELRSRLALANTKLVSHLAMRFRDRGISYADLQQEGFCGLLEAIDRFDLRHETKLATYATWWIRQAIQRAVAAGAYPVRLTPRHLRQLARNQAGGESPAPAEGSRSEIAPARNRLDIIPFIHAATRPAISFNATPRSGGPFNLLQAIGGPQSESDSQVDHRDVISHLMSALHPREQQVLTLRFGLGDQDCLSLSEVGRILAVSKERVRQIEERALQKLKAREQEQSLSEH